jgi:branched-chain amino acid transport system ATP-binding protein
LEVHKGEIVALVGSNGAGKSTTLWTISGLLKPKRGQITFQKKDVTGYGPAAIRETGISLVPEGRRLFAGLTVKENLEMGAFLRKDDISNDLEQMLEIFPMARERSAQLAGTLSGGEQQMVAIARGLMSRPILLMIDELSLGLAPLVVGDLITKITQLRQTGLTMLLVEQDVNTALSISDRAYVMEQGQIVRFGESRALLNDESIIECYLGV